MNALEMVKKLLAGNQNRILLEVPLRPVQGVRFQPTGFPDLGAALFADPANEGEERVLIESVQSMGNRLEAVCWDDESQDVVAALKQLPYIKVVGEAETNSILEPHRINSSYILSDAAFKEELVALAGLGEGAVSRPLLAKALLELDPNTLVHGVFLANIGNGSGRLERALSAFIEGEGVTQAVSGGVKADRVTISAKDLGGSEEGFGNIVFSRTEYVARAITAYFNLDLAQIRSLRLPLIGAQLITLLSLFKIRAFLDSPMRLRTACDLELAEGSWKMRPEGFELPSMEELEVALPKIIAAAKAEKIIGGVRTVQFVKGAKARTEKKPKGRAAAPKGDE